jgi:hypothetical protein
MLGKILFIVCLLAMVPIVFIIITRYVDDTVAVTETIGDLELVGAPDWINERLKQKIVDAAVSNGEDLRLDEDAAVSVRQNLSQISWLEDVTIQTTNTSIRILASWRKPLALIKFGAEKFYVDKNLIVMDYIPVPKLAIIEVKNVQVNRLPKLGQKWELADLVAAVEILEQFNIWDGIQTPDKPLLNEIASIDVKNFDGRSDSRSAHIILYTTDNTEIIWGAQIGAWQRHIESPDEEKLAKLYTYYKEQGSLLGGAKYINLRDPQDKIPLPIDKY